MIQKKTVDQLIKQCVKKTCPNPCPDHAERSREFAETKKDYEYEVKKTKLGSACDIEAGRKHTAKALGI